MQRNISTITFGAAITVAAYLTSQPAWASITLGGLTVALAGVVTARAVIRRGR